MIKLKGLDHNLNYLIAVSGGIDSVVMAYAFIKAGYKVAIAHCNFSLRGAESDGDEQFVETLAKTNNVTIHKAKFDTIGYAQENGMSIQIAARKLRYHFFEKLQTECGYDKTAIAHNADDNIETFFINLIRGTGLKGLAGMQSETSNIIRPLLSTSRKEIEAYAKENGIKYREDSSNSSDDYLRNYLRHKVIPLLFGANASFGKRMIANFDYLKKTSDFISSEMDVKQHSLLVYSNNEILISIELLKQSGCADLLLFHALEQYGFKGNVINDIVDCLDSQAGKQFMSQSHVLTKDRNNFILAEINTDTATFKVYEADLPFTHGNMFFEKVEVTSDFKLSKSKHIAQLDYDKIKFPLTVRLWRNGDKFIPFGMNNFKKLSDFFIGEKLPLNRKQNALVITSNENIIWVAGMRTDNRYAVNDNVKFILKITQVC